MPERLKSRKDVSKKLTWDLSSLYPTELEMWEELERVRTISINLEKTFRGKLNHPESINACLEQYRQMMEMGSRCGYYADLSASVDHTDSFLQERNQKVKLFLSECEARVAFLKTEIAAQNLLVLETAMNQATACKGYIKELIRQKPHQVDPAIERVLTTLSPIIELPYEAYQAAKLADLQFEPFEADGETYPLSYSLFEKNYEYDKRDAVRRTAFFAFSKKIRQYANVNAALYNGYVQREKIMSDLRGFSSIFEKDLFLQKIDRTLYERQIDIIMEKLPPHMRRYARLLKKIHKLDRLTYADLKLPVDPEYVPEVSISDAEQYIKEALVCFGPEYIQMLDDSFRKRWIDFAQNIGKSTGGFCASPYGTNSFTLLSWNGKMSDVFTLAHEMGHAGHYELANSHQSIFDANVSIYFEEAPSTMNELLLSQHLLKTNCDRRFRRWVLANMVGNTYYHNCVTHLIEAAYQREVYKLVDAGRSLSADLLNTLLKKVLQDFWGEDVELIEGAELTWMRQPHYYLGLYSYTYSAGVTIATQMYKRIEKEGDKAISDWKKAMCAGGSLSPVELAALLKIDILTETPLMDTIKTIGGYIDEICVLTEELERSC